MFQNDTIGRVYNKIIKVTIYLHTAVKSRINVVRFGDTKNTVKTAGTTNNCEEITVTFGRCLIQGDYDMDVVT